MMKLEVCECDLVRVIRQSLDDFESLVGARQIDFEHPTPPAVVLADEEIVAGPRPCVACRSATTSLSSTNPAASSPASGRSKTSSSPLESFGPRPVAATNSP